jgi:two-component system, chemotaxis family, chemotaxis protein CheY
MAHIVVIDDDTELLEAMRRTLENRGHDVGSASDGSAGMKLIDERPPDMVVTDLVMPEKEGIETIVELGERYPRMPVMAISPTDGRGSQGALRDAEMLGARRTLCKPFSMDDFVTCVEAILASLPLPASG